MHQLCQPNCQQDATAQCGHGGHHLLFPAHKPTRKKARKEKYPFKHPNLDTLCNMVDSKPTMSLPNNSVASHSSYCWTPQLVGLTTPVPMKSDDYVLPIPMCHTVPLIGTSTLVKQVDAFWDLNEDLVQLGQRGYVFEEEFLAKDGEILSNMKNEADTVGLRWGGIFNVACPSPNVPRDPGDRAVVYAVILTGRGGQNKGLHLPHFAISQPSNLPVSQWLLQPGKHGDCNHQCNAFVGRKHEKSPIGRGPQKNRWTPCCPHCHIHNGMRCSRAQCGIPPILGVVHMGGTRTVTCYMGAL